MNYLLSLATTNIRNGYLAKKDSITIKQYNKMIINVLKILEENGFIKSFNINENNELKVFLLYKKTNKYNNYCITPVLYKIIFLAKSSLLVYKRCSELNKLTREILILTTNKGIMTHSEAIKKNVGGRPLIKIIL